MSQVRIKALNTQETAHHTLPSIEEFAVVLFSLIVGSLLVLLCLGDVVAAIGLLVLLCLGLAICAGVAGLVYACVGIVKKLSR